MSAEIDYYELFGLTADAGEEETEIAEPLEQPEGEKEVELADPPEDMEDVEEPEETPADEDDNEPDQPQSREERAKNAAARRKREQDAAIQAAVDAALQAERADQAQKLKDFFASAGMRDPNRDNAPITSLEEYQQYQQATALKKAEADLRRGKLTPETIQQIVAQTPAMQQAQQIIQRAEQEKQQAQRQSAQARVDAEIAEINKMDPTISSLQDLLASENGQRVYELVKRPPTLVEAFQLANFDQLTSKAAAAGQAKKSASEASKSHLRSTTARGHGSVDVPPGELATYRQLMPSATDAEIRKHYNNYLKSLKRG